jgi:hypothetical protein
MAASPRSARCTNRNTRNGEIREVRGESLTDKTQVTEAMIQKVKLSDRSHPHLQLILFARDYYYFVYFVRNRVCVRNRDVVFITEALTSHGKFS